MGEELGNYVHQNMGEELGNYVHQNMGEELGNYHGGSRTLPNSAWVVPNMHRRSCGPHMPVHNWLRAHRPDLQCQGHTTRSSHDRMPPCRWYEDRIAGAQDNGPAISSASPAVSGT